MLVGAGDRAGGGTLGQHHLLGRPQRQGTIDGQVGELRRAGERRHVEGITHLTRHWRQLGMLAILGLQILLVFCIVEAAHPAIVELAAVDAGAPAHGHIAVHRHRAGYPSSLQGEVAAPLQVAIHPYYLVGGRGDGDIAPRGQAAGDGG